MIQFFVIPVLVLVLDRITKLWAIQYACQKPLSVVGNFVSCMVTYNRGISWSLLSYQDIMGYGFVTALIVGVIGMLIFHMIVEYRKNSALFGELLVLCGAVSNLYDRFIYGGVVDFILIQYGSWSFPIFNIADIAIVCGVLIMFYDATLRRTTL
jgi:signal peptidase II